MAEPRRSAMPFVEAAGARFLVVEARFYDDIGTLLLAGARQAFVAAGVEVEVVTVPGALEIAPALAMLIEDGGFAGAVALGCVIRGETYHFEIVCNESSRALTQVAVDWLLRCGNGILPVQPQEQAIGRADPARGDKGGDAARAALALWAIKQQRDAA